MLCVLQRGSGKGHGSTKTESRAAVQRRGGRRGDSSKWEKNAKREAAEEGNQKRKGKPGSGQGRSLRRVAKAGPKERGEPNDLRSGGCRDERRPKGQKRRRGRALQQKGIGSRFSYSSTELRGQAGVWLHGACANSGADRKLLSKKRRSCWSARFQWQGSPERRNVAALASLKLQKGDAPPLHFSDSLACLHTLFSSEPPCAASRAKSGLEP